MITAINTIRNGIKNGYPVAESILSILPLVDEYLVNDGGSTDDTLALLQDLSYFYPKIRVFKLKDTKSERWDCVSDQLNQLIKRARGDWIFLGNMDELLHERDVRELREIILRERYADVLRYDRKEVTHRWSRLTQETYYPARTARKLPSLYQNWNSYGGDEFLDSNGWIKDIPRVKQLKTIIYHLYDVFPKNTLNKRKNDAKWLAPGDKGRVKIYESIKDKNFGGSRIPDPKDVYPDLPALARALPFMDEYFIRECLFDSEWLWFCTGIDYEL